MPWKRKNYLKVGEGKRMSKNRRKIFTTEHIISELE